MTLRVELEELRRFSFDAMSEIGKHFNCSVPWINEKWEIVHGTERNRRLKAEAEEKRVKEAAAAAAARKAATDAANAETAARLAGVAAALDSLKAASIAATAAATQPYLNITETAAAAATEIAAKIAADGYKAPPPS
jgi:beta-phosphoglucomutase-like phosphatase (HAD superfamily)